VLRAATFVGAASVLLSLIGFLRWGFVVPPLAEGYVAGDPTTQAAVAAAWTAQHQFGGALLGEHLGQLLVIGTSPACSAAPCGAPGWSPWASRSWLVALGVALLRRPPGPPPPPERSRPPRSTPRPGRGL
jgi:hypothetical protein